ncbi:unnamed protein product [Prorocentrum cordatum]|uniref:2'-phosphotransferase n=1 Tax=Prorocentrum cordatum TaxID=2364126 RepID=A0ABN9Y8Q5_9DINO|nr:unnamed protein product [Polarella glacialis]
MEAAAEPSEPTAAQRRHAAQGAAAAAPACAPAARELPLRPPAALQPAGPAAEAGPPPPAGSPGRGPQPAPWAEPPWGPWAPDGAEDVVGISGCRWCQKGECWAHGQVGRPGVRGPHFRPRARGPGERCSHGALSIPGVGCTQACPDEEAMSLLSRKLAAILRHKAPEWGVELQGREGWSRVSDLLRLRTWEAYAESDVAWAAHASLSHGKPRFELRSWRSEFWVRALGKHTLPPPSQQAPWEVDAALEAVEQPAQQAQQAAAAGGAPDEAAGVAAEARPPPDEPWPCWEEVARAEAEAASGSPPAAAAGPAAHGVREHLASVILRLPCLDCGEEVECLYCISEACARFREQNKDAAPLQGMQANQVLVLRPTEQGEVKADWCLEGGGASGSSGAGAGAGADDGAAHWRAACHTASIRRRWDEFEALGGRASNPQGSQAGLTVPQAFEALGLTEGATAAELAASFRRLSREHHPDKVGSSGAFNALTAAHEVAKRFVVEAERRRAAPTAWRAH